MIAPKTQGFERELIPAKTHLVKCISIIDTGTETSVFNQNGVDQEVTARKVWITFEFPNIQKEFEGVMKPLVKGSSFSLSFHEKSKLYAFIKSWGFDVNVKDGFDMSQLLGKAGLGAVTHTTAKNGNTYDNLVTVSPLMDGMEDDGKTFNPLVMFDMDSGEGMQNLQDKVNAMPKFLQEKIKASPERLKLSEEYMEHQEKFEAPTSDDDLPF